MEGCKWGPGEVSGGASSWQSGKREEVGGLWWVCVDTWTEKRTREVMRTFHGSRKDGAGWVFEFEVVNV